MQHVAHLSKALSLRLVAQLRQPLAGLLNHHCVHSTHTQVAMGTQGVFPCPKSARSERGTPPEQQEDKDGQLN